MKERLQFLDVIDVYDGRPADAEEIAPFEALFHCRHRFAVQMRFLADMQADIIVGGFDPLNIIDPQKNHLAGGFNGQSIHPRLRFHVGQKLRVG